MTMSTPKSVLSHQVTPPGVDRDWDSIENGQRALLNILEDFAAEKTRLQGPQRAGLKILEDFAVERSAMENEQRAMFNLFEEFVAATTNSQHPHLAHLP